jgi:hypothetical protein
MSGFERVSREVAVPLLCGALRNLCVLCVRTKQDRKVRQEKTQRFAMTIRVVLNLHGTMEVESLLSFAKNGIQDQLLK